MGDVLQAIVPVNGARKSRPLQRRSACLLFIIGRVRALNSCIASQVRSSTCPVSDWRKPRGAGGTVEHRRVRVRDLAHERAYISMARPLRLVDIGRKLR